jgi:hypothetical protein
MRNDSYSVALDVGRDLGESEYGYRDTVRRKRTFASDTEEEDDIVCEGSVLCFVQDVAEWKDVVFTYEFERTVLAHRGTSVAVECGVDVSLQRAEGGWGRHRTGWQKAGRCQFRGFFWTTVV